MLKVNCAFTRLADPKSLRPNPDNPNVHPAKQIELFMKILAYNGVRRAIVVSRRSGLITKGHGLLQAALEMNAPEVPVDDQDYADDASELADMLADNELASWSEISEPKFKELVGRLNNGELDLEVVGRDRESLEKLFAELKSSKPTIEFSASASPGDAASEAGGGSESSSAPAAPATNIAQVRMVQLYLNTETEPVFMERVETLKRTLGVDNLTDAVFEAVERVALHLGDEHPVEGAQDEPASEAVLE
jgi:hypothetical protein